MRDQFDINQPVPLWANWLMVAGCFLLAVLVARGIQRHADSFKSHAAVDRQAETVGNRDNNQ